MSKTIEEEIRTYAQMCSLDEAGYVAIEKAIQFGIDLHKSLPLSQRLTDEEREKMRKLYIDANDKLKICLNAMNHNQISEFDNEYKKGINMGLILALKHIFGKELFGEE